MKFGLFLKRGGRLRFPRWRHGTAGKGHGTASGEEEQMKGLIADVLCAYHRKCELAVHLRTDHPRTDVDYPCDLAQARPLYRPRDAAEVA
jgi:hypothetical protein